MHFDINNRSVVPSVTDLSKEDDRQNYVSRRHGYGNRYHEVTATNAGTNHVNVSADTPKLSLPGNKRYQYACTFKGMYFLSDECANEVLYIYVLLTKIIICFVHLKRGKK